VLGGVAFRKHGGDGLFAGIGVMNFAFGCLAYVALMTPAFGGLRRSRSLANLANLAARRNGGGEGRFRFFGKSSAFGAGYRPVAESDEVEMGVSPTAREPSAETRA
jgi:hypothetical protein